MASGRGASPQGRVDQQILEAPVRHQGRGVAAAGQWLDQDLAALHGGVGVMPAAASMPSVSVSGRPDDVGVGAADPGDRSRRRGPGSRSRRPCPAIRRRRGRRRSRRASRRLKRTAVSTARRPAPLAAARPRRRSTTRCRRPESRRRKRRGLGRVGGLAEDAPAERRRRCRRRAPRRRDRR